MGGSCFLGIKGGLGVMCLVLVSWQQHGAEGLSMQGEEKPAGIWGLQEPASWKGAWNLPPGLGRGEWTQVGAKVAVHIEEGDQRERRERDHLYINHSNYKSFGEHWSIEESRT